MSITLFQFLDGLMWDIFQTKELLASVNSQGCRYFWEKTPNTEVMTAQIANVINEVLEPKGVAVVMDAKHQCMTTRGIHKTRKFYGYIKHARRFQGECSNKRRIHEYDCSLSALN